MTIILGTKETWKEVIRELVRMDVDFATGNEDNKRVTIYSGSDKFDYTTLAERTFLRKK